MACIRLETGIPIQYYEKSKTFIIFTVWKLRKITLTHFWKKFRESNGYTKEITK